MIMHVTKEQLCGAVVIVLITTFIYVGRFSLHHFRPFHAPSISYAEKTTGAAVVELTGDTDHKGIYFLPPKTSVSDLFRIAKVTNIRRFEEKTLAVVLGTGEKVIIDSNQIKIKEIDAAKRIALDIPININSARTYDLVLIPSIGKKTAQAIVKLREKAGGIISIDDLLKIYGMSEKKLNKIKKYLYVNDRTCRITPKF